MKQIQVTVPEDKSGKVEEVLVDLSSDVYSVDAEDEDQSLKVFHATVESSDIDELVDDLKSIKDIEHGELKIRVFQEESLIQKGHKTRSSSSMLSQEEVYSKAQESSTFGRTQWALMAISSSVAAYGLILDNLAVVIGAMMFAPMLSPLVSSAISLTVGDKTLLKEAFRTSFLALVLSILVAIISVIPFNATTNSTLNLIVSAGVPNMILSLFVGAAASLAFVAGLRDQIAGVAVSIALVPPLAAAGVGIKIGDLLFTSRAFSIAAVNFLAVLISGSVSLKLLGFSPSTYYKKQSAKEMRVIFPLSITAMVLAMMFLLMRPF